MCVRTCWRSLSSSRIRRYPLHIRSLRTLSQWYLGCRVPPTITARCTRHKRSICRAEGSQNIDGRQVQRHHAVWRPCQEGAQLGRRRARCLLDSHIGPPLAVDTDLLLGGGRPRCASSGPAIAASNCVGIRYCWNTCHVASGWNNDIKASAADVIIAKFFHDRHKALLPVGGLSSK